MYLTRPIVIKALGALEAVLWNRGHKYLAILATCYVEDVGSTDMLVSTIDSKMRISTELQERIIEKYPYTKPINQKRIQNINSNLTLESIDILSDNFARHTWKYTTSKSRVKEVMSGVVSKRYMVIPEIKNILAELILDF